MEVGALELSEPGDPMPGPRVGPGPGDPRPGPRVGPGSGSREDMEQGSFCTQTHKR